MKKIFLLPILVLFIFTNCEKVVDIDVPSTTPKLIIDAVFEVYFTETPIRANTVVKLSKSADYFDEKIPAVTNATVFLTNLSDNSIINFSDTNADGNYEPTISFIPAENVVYELTIIHENNTYKGTATRIKSTPLTSVIQGDETLFAGTETEVKVTFSDDATQENFYLFDFSKQLFLTIEDRFFNGSDYNFSYFYDEEDITLPTTVNIKMSGISKEFYTYYRVLIDQSGQNAGGPFETIPSSLLGNMINITDESKFPLGYFHISETDIKSLNLVEKN